MLEKSPPIRRELEYYAGLASEKAGITALKTLGAVLRWTDFL